jgi:hypothetical protein
VLRSKVGDCESPEGRESCKVSSYDRHTWPKDDPRGYEVGFVEFDDQGRMLSPNQFNYLMEQIEHRSKTDDVSIVVYVHGWHHDASDEDEDVKRFHDILEALSFSEKTRSIQNIISNDQICEVSSSDQKSQLSRLRKRRNVIGIFVSWPARWILTDFPQPFRSLNFPFRKGAAERIAQGSILELFARVRHLHEAISHQPDYDPRLVFAGHSFGAQIVYQAAQSHFISEASKLKASNVPYLVKPYGNLVILINPAFEGMRFEALDEMIINRDNIHPDQQPVLVTFASENDWAVRYWFPFGRFFSSGLQLTRASYDQFGPILKSVGYVDRFQTHSLKLEQADSDEFSDSRELPWGNPVEMTKYMNEREEYEQNEIRNFRSKNMDGESCKLIPGWRRKYTQGAVLTHRLRERKVIHTGRLPMRLSGLFRSISG